MRVLTKRVGIEEALKKLDENFGIVSTVEECIRFLGVVVGKRVYVELNYSVRNGKPDGDVVILEYLLGIKIFKIDPYSDDTKRRREVREILTSIGLRD